MTFDMFMKFCADFEIFPDICPRSLLHKIFHLLSSLSDVNEQVSINGKASSGGELSKLDTTRSQSRTFKKSPRMTQAPTPV